MEVICELVVVLYCHMSEVRFFPYSFSNLCRVRRIHQRNMEINTEISTSSLIRVRSHLSKAPGAKAKVVSGKGVMSNWG